MKNLSSMHLLKINEAYIESFEMNWIYAIANVTYMSIAHRDRFCPSQHDSNSPVSINARLGTAYA